MSATLPCKTRMVRPPVDEMELVSRAQRGDRAAMEELARRFRPKLVHLLERKLRCRADAEDVTQQSLVRALQRIDQHDGRRPFFAWLFRIAMRIAADERRKMRPDSGLDAHDLHDPNGNAPEKAICDAELRDNLWSVAREVLSADQYSALWLKYVEGFSTREVAHALARTRIATRVLLHRARRRLAPRVIDLAEPSVEPSNVSNSGEMS